MSSLFDLFMRFFASNFTFALKSQSIIVFCSGAQKVGFFFSEMKYRLKLYNDSTMELGKGYFHCQ